MPKTVEVSIGKVIITTENPELMFDKNKDFLTTKEYDDIAFVRVFPAAGYSTVHLYKINSSKQGYLAYIVNFAKEVECIDE